jgi:hypothetical protein
MKKHLVTLFVLFNYLVIQAQEFELSVVFKPSFLNTASLDIKGSKAVFSTSDNRNDSIIDEKFEFKLSEFQRTNLHQFLTTFNYTSKSSADTIGFKAEIIDGDTTITSYTVLATTDGINVYGIYKDNKNHKAFKFHSPHKNSKDYKLSMRLIELLYSNLDTDNGLEFAEELSSYFNISSFGITRINDSTFSIFGPFKGYENEIDSWVKVTECFSNYPYSRLYLDLRGFRGLRDKSFKNIFFGSIPSKKTKVTFFVKSNAQREELLEIGFKNTQVVLKN